MCKIITILRTILAQTKKSPTEEEAKGEIIKDLIKQYNYTSGKNRVSSFKKDIISETFRTDDLLTQSLLETSQHKYECIGCGIIFKNIEIKECLLDDPSKEEFYNSHIYKHVVCKRLHERGFDQRNKDYSPPDLMETTEESVKL